MARFSVVAMALGAMAVLSAAPGPVALAAPISTTSPPAPSSGPTTVPPPSTPELYYTTNHPPALKVADYSIGGDLLQISNIRTVATLPGADGLAIAPDGDVLVGGGGSGKVYKVDPQTGSYQTESAYPGATAAYHVSTSSDGSHAWTAGLPGTLASLPLSPFGTGTAVPVQGDDGLLTTVAFTPAGTFYTSGNSLGSGNFGTLDLASGTTHRVLTNQRGAHGISYDPYTKDLFLFGSFNIVQIDPLAITQPGPDHAEVELSLRTVGNVAFDQGVADGAGHLLVASNTGEVWFFDYSATGLIGSAKGVLFSRAFLDTNLDDIIAIRPRSSAAGSAASSSSKSSSKKKLLIVVLAVIVLAVLGFLVIRSRRSAKPEGGGYLDRV